MTLNPCIKYNANYSKQARRRDYKATEIIKQDSGQLVDYKTLSSASVVFTERDTT